EQFRYPMKEIVLEIPAGKLEWGENPDSAVERELREETGFTADNIEYLGVNYPTPGYCAEKLYLYMATGLHKGEQELDADEYLNVKSVPFSVAVDMVMNNSIKDSKTVAAILLAARRLGL
ncbi:MAG: NUDIX hydrolase, partial [Oscillospiraceae bacterium]